MIKYLFVFSILFIMPVLMGLGIYWVATSIWSQLHGPDFFVKRAAKELGILEVEVKNHFRTLVLNDAKKMCEEHGVTTNLEPKYPRNKVWQIGASTDKKKRICYSPVWIYLVVTKPHIWRYAFLLSIGHEIAHWSEPKFCWSVVLKGFSALKAYFWISEVRCDFYGLRIVEKHLEEKGITRKPLLNAMKHKADYYDKGKKHPGRAAFSHPAWRKRVALLKKYGEFSSDVVKNVAYTACCFDDAYIEQVANRMLYSCDEI